MNTIITNDVMQQITFAANNSRNIAILMLCMVFIVFAVVGILLVRKSNNMSPGLAIVMVIVCCITGLSSLASLKKNNEILANPVQYAVNNQQIIREVGDTGSFCYGAEYSLDGKKIKDVVIVVKTSHTLTIKDINDFIDAQPRNQPK